MPRVPPEIQERYGKILFAEHEKFKQKGAGKEENTYIENDKFHALVSFVNSNYGPNITRDIISFFKILVKHKKYYPEVLDPGNPKELLRGITVGWNIDKRKYDEVLKIAKTLKYANRLVNQRKFDNSKFIKLPKQITYRPRTYVESWTVSEGIAVGFSGHDYMRRSEPPHAGMIISCKPPKSEMLFNPDFTNSLTFQEHEIVRVSDKPIKCDAYIDKMHWNSFVSLIPRF